MPSIRCSSCGHRILLPIDRETCANCGALLTQQYMASQQTAAVEQLLNPFESEEPPPPDISLSRTANQSPRLPSSSGQKISSSDEQTEKARDLQLYQQRSVSSYQPVQETYSLQPYYSTQIAPLDPRGDLATPFAADNAELATPHLSPLPLGFPKRPPDIEGTIIHVQSQTENPMTPDSVEFIFKLFRDLIWAVPHEQHNQQLRQVNVTTLRIRISDGAQKDARLEGYMRGVNLSLGDTVSLWGHRRRGLLRVYRGYNHTSKGVVKTTATSSAATVFLMLIMFIVVCYLLLNWMHIHLPY
jgi:hypothetical protein